MFRAVVVGHGAFAAGIVSAVTQIAGGDERFVALSNQDYAADQLERRLLDETEDQSVCVVFTDLPGGSAALAARKAMRARPGLLLVTGANVATLLEFALSTAADPHEAARSAAAKGQAAIAFIEPR